MSRSAVGILIGLALLFLIFRHTDLSLVAKTIRNANIRLLIFAQCLLLVIVFIRTWRMKCIFQASPPPRFWRLFRATQIGDFTNLFVPAQGGDAVRALALSRLEGQELLLCMGFVAVDRLADLVALAFITFIGLAAYQPMTAAIVIKEIFGHDLVITPDLVTTVVHTGSLALFALVIVLTLTCLRTDLILACVGVVSRRLPEKAAARIDRHFGVLARGLSVIKVRHVALKAMGLTLLDMGGLILAITCITQAFHIHAPWYTGFLMPMFLAAAITTSASPGAIGQFHAGAVVALVALVPGIDMVVAGAFAVVFHILEFAPLALLGPFCLYWDGAAIIGKGPKT